MFYDFDVKCAFGAAIISVLIYCLLVTYILPGAGGKMENTEWYRSMEFLMLISVFIGYNINQKVFNMCRIG